MVLSGSAHQPVLAGLPAVAACYDQDCCRSSLSRHTESESVRSVRRVPPVVQKVALQHAPPESRQLLQKTPAKVNERLEDKLIGG